MQLQNAPTAETPPAGFGPPLFDQPFDLEGYKAAIPHEAAIKGMFFNYMAEQAGGVNTSGRHRIPFKNYPARDFVDFASRLSTVAFPEVPLGEAVRRFGQGTFRGFADTLVGKAMLATVMTNFHDVLALCPRAYAVAGSMAFARHIDVSERAAIIELRSCFDLPQFHEVGVFEGVLAHYGLKGDVLVNIRQPGDIDLYLSWTS